MTDIWDIEHLRVGGGTEGEEYVACSVKVSLDGWRLTKGFVTIQEAIDALS